MQGVGENRWPKALAGVVAAAAALWLVLVAQVYFIHDDFMYVTTAALLPQHSLYTALPYLQMPLLSWGQAGVLGLLGAGWAGYQLLISLGIYMVLAGCYFALNTVRSRHPAVLLMTWLALLGSFSVITIAGTTSNHALQLVLAGALLWLCLSGAATPQRALAAGVLCGLMISAKLNSLPFVLPLLFWLWQGERRFKTALYAGIGGFFALLPVLWIFVQDPAAFWYANITAPLLNTALRGSSTMGEVAAMLYRQLAMPPVLALVGSLLFCMIQVSARLPKPRLHLWGVFMAAGLGAALIPGKVYDFHFAPFMLVACAFCGDMLAAHIGAATAQVRWRLVCFLLVPVMLIGAGTLATSGLLKSEPAKSVTMERIAASYRQALAANPTCAGSVFSTAAIPALAGPLPVHPASAAGPFVIRIEPEKTITAVLESRPAVLAGYHDDMAYEQALVAALKERHYRPLPLGTYRLGERVASWVLWLPRCYA